MRPNPLAPFPKREGGTTAANAITEAVERSVFDLCQSLIHRNFVFVGVAPYRFGKGTGVRSPLGEKYIIQPTRHGICDTNHFSRFSRLIPKRAEILRYPHVE